MEVSREQYIAAFNKLPEQVRSFLVDNELEKVVQALGTTYGLHVDVQGTLNKSASYMLMGLQSPTELLGELVMAGVDAETAKKILADLNAKVFTPLRAQMESGGTSTPGNKPASDQRPTAREAAPSVSSSIPVSEEKPAEPIIQAPAYMPPSPPPAPAPKPVAVPMVASTTPMPIPAPSAPSVPYPQEEHYQMRTMATDMQAIKEHRMPEPIPSQVPVAQVSLPSTPRVVVTPIPAPAAPHIQTPTPAPSVVMPPPMPPRPHESVLPQQPVPQPPVIETPQVQKIVPPPTNLPQIPQPNQYPVDPYREPLD